MGTMGAPWDPMGATSWEPADTTPPILLAQVEVRVREEDEPVWVAARGLHRAPTSSLRAMGTLLTYACTVCVRLACTMHVAGDGARLRCVGRRLVCRTHRAARQLGRMGRLFVHRRHTRAPPIPARPDRSRTQVAHTLASQGSTGRKRARTGGVSSKWRRRRRRRRPSRTTVARCRKWATSSASATTYAPAK